MDRFDLARQGISSLEQVSDDIVRQVEPSSDGENEASSGQDRFEYEYALSFAQNRIIEVHAIGRFARVSQLDLSSNKIVSLEGVQALRRLESLNLARNNLTSVDLLASLPNLRVLSVAENSIVQLDGLRECRELMVLDASYNNVTKWPRLGDMATLESLDLSSNLLEAFAPSAVPGQFPDSLRRLSIAKNQIHELCGIAALGAHLSKLQSLSLEGNVVVNQIAKSGGKLGFLLTNFFPSLSSSTAAAGRSEDEYLVSRSTVASVQLAIQHRNEDALLAFLKTGSGVSQCESDGPMTCKAVVASTIQSSRFKVEELALPQPPVVAVVSTPALVSNAAPAANPPAASADEIISPTALSKEGKMEMWKRITEERKAAQEKEKERLQRRLTNGQDASPAETNQPRSDVVMLSSNMVADQAPILPVKLSSGQVQRTAEVESTKPLAQPLPPSPPAAPTHLRYPQKQDRTNIYATPNPLQATAVVAQESRTRAGGGGESMLGSDSSSNLAGQVKVLSEQVATMRKYMKVWIKREQMAREAAARRIQRWCRHQRFRRVIVARIAAMRQKWSAKYSPILRQNDAHSSTTNSQIQWTKLLAAVIRIQRAWRDFVKQRAAILGFSPPRKSRSNTQSHLQQSHQISAKVINAVAHFGADVKQLQQVCVVQERAMIELWDNTARLRRYLDHRIDKAVIRFQSLWRGWKARKAHGVVCRKWSNPSVEVMTLKRTMQLQNQEIARLAHQVEKLQSAVERLLADKL